MNNTPNAYPSLSQAAADLGISAKTLKRWIDIGKIKATRRLNRTFAVPFSEVQRIKAEGHGAQ